LKSAIFTHFDLRDLDLGFGHTCIIYRPLDTYQVSFKS